MADLVAKTDIQFPWKGTIHADLGRLALAHNRGDVVDVGCGTCQVYHHLVKNGWRGKYVGIDAVAYDGVSYPPEVQMLFGDALTMELPSANTFVLYDVLEHVSDPIALLAKCVQAADNVLVAVPKRNEDLWSHGVVEYHQLDKTHQHWGFNSYELRRLVNCSGGQIARSEELVKTDLLSVLGAFTKNDVFHRFVQLLMNLYPTQSYAQELWCEVVKA